MRAQELASVPRGRFRAEQIYIGWQRAGRPPEPGPVPESLGEVELDEISTDWLAARRREYARQVRPARAGLSASLAMAAACLIAGVASRPAASTALEVTAAGAAMVAVACGRLIWRRSRDLTRALRDEEQRVAARRRVQRSQFADRQRKHAGEYREWQRRTSAVWRQPQWFPVTVPDSVNRVDVAGGTLPGWSALLTTLAGARLAAGGEVTVLDLTESAIGADLISLATSWGLDPLVWVLPADLPRLDLGTGLGSEGLADLLALTVSAADSYGRGADERGGTADPPRDAALLASVLGILGEDATMQRLIAALRALAQVGGARQHLDSGELWQDQLTRLAGLFGRGGERLVTDRAMAMEARLRTLALLASAPASRPPSRLRVACLDRRATAVGNAVVGSYLAVALTAALRQAPASQPWQQTVCVLGAERLPGDVLDRLSDAAETAGTGLVLGYRSIPVHIKERLGRGNSAVAFMRLGNAEDARLAAEQIGTEHRFVISQLTDTVGASVTDTVGDSYSSTVGTADSVSDSSSLTLSAGRSRGRGRSGHGAFAPFADFTGSVSMDASSSTATSDSRSVTQGINASTSWGKNTARAIGGSDSLAASAQRSREFVVEASELQHLPHSAVVLTYAGPAGRQVLLADANPAIMSLPTATLARPADP